MMSRSTWRPSRQPAPAWRGAAFTLPEVLATMVLIGIVVPVAMSGLSLALAAASHARYTAQAASLGEAKLMELVATGQWLNGVGSGDFSPDWPQYRWTAQMSTADFNVNEIILQVTWTERGAEQSLLVSTMVFDTSITASSTETTSTSGGTQ